jgi:hypothetical protein
MTDELIFADIRDYITRHIDFVTQLEALLLLRGDPRETWDLPSVARRLYTTEQETSQVLVLLCNDRLLAVSDGIFPLRPGTHSRDEHDP